MNEILKDILKGLAGLGLTLLLPKYILFSIREILKFGIKSIVKIWYVSLCIITISIFIWYNIEVGKYIDPFTFIVLTFSTIFLTTFLIYLHKSLKVNYKGMNSAIYGCYSVKEQEYLQVDIDAESINQKLKQICQKYNSTIFIFKTGLLQLNYIEFPKFISTLLGYEGINSKIQKRVLSKTHVFAIHYFREIGEQKLLIELNYNKTDFSNPEFVEKVIAIFNIISEKSNLSNLGIVEISIKFLTLIFSQTLIDYLIDSKDYGKIHTTLEDVEKLLEEIREETLQLNIEQNNKEFTNFYSTWKSVVERYKAILLIEENQISGAVKYIFKSITTNPYYPYDNYESFKKNYTKKYAISYTYAKEETDPILEVTNLKDYNLAREKLADQIESFDATFNTEIILEIIRLNKTKEIIKLIEMNLDRLDKSNPALLLLKSDIIKHLPKGNKKFNEIYILRFDDCIDPIKDLLLIDKDFPLMHMKLGGLLSCKGINYDNKILIKQGMEEWKKGIHLYTELGL